MSDLNRIFDSISQDVIFNNKIFLQTTYTPESIPYRDKQIEQIASILAPALRKDKPSNLFVYGQTGSGKTLSVCYVKNEMINRAKKNSLPL